MNTLHHTADTICLYCEIKLALARPELGEYFHAIKKAHPDVHISWSYRNQIDQERFVSEGKSKAHYPHSKHNKTTKDDKPMSHAIDIFEINAEHPGGLWSFPFCQKVYEKFKRQFPHIVWGGTFKDQPGDGDHFEIEVDEETGSVIVPEVQAKC